jgi:rhodanese-related sulfurtransferase
MKTLGMNIAATGITEREAREMGYSILTSIVPWMDRAHYYPGGKPILLKLIADEKDGRILGGQVVGPGDVTKRIDTISAALSSRATIEDAANLDVGYAPPFATALDGVAHAANVLLNKRDGLAKSISAVDVRARIERDEDFVLLDVREANEVEKNSFNDQRVVAVPLSRLRTAKDEIPKNKELICFCQLGMRSYEACRTLEGMGFNKVRYLEGGFRFWSESANAQE